MHPYPGFPECEEYRINDHPGSGYQAKITLTWKPGMMLDFRDIRFHDQEGRKIPYWIESQTDGVSAVVWVKLTASKVIFVRWGNGAAVSESNGDNVFLFFDDFLGGAIDANKWTATGTVVTSDGDCVYSSTGELSKLVSKTDFQYKTLEFSFNTPNANTTNGIGFRTDGSPWYSSYINAEPGLFKSVTELAGGRSTNTYPLEYNTQNKIKIERSSTNVKFYLNDSLISTHTTNLPTVSTPIRILGLRSSGNVEGIVAYIFVRENVSTTPTLTKISSGYTSPLERIAPLLESGSSGTTENISSTVTGSGSSSSTILKSISVSFSTSGTGSSLSTITKTLAGELSSTVSGSGSSSATVSILQAISSIVEGTGSTEAIIALYDLISSLENGIGSSSATTSILDLLNSTVSGAGYSTSTASKAVEGELSSLASGVGSSSASVSLLKQISTSLQGSGSSQIQAAIQKIISSLESGTGASSATSTMDVFIPGQVSSSVSGTGSYSVSVSLSKIISCTVSGVGYSYVTAFVVGQTGDFNYPLTVQILQNIRAVSTYQDVRLVRVFQ